MLDDGRYRKGFFGKGVGNQSVRRDDPDAVADRNADLGGGIAVNRMISYGLEGMSEQEYLVMFFNRILSVLKCAAYFGYEDLVLGAWGCGAFGNDAAVVSDLFCRAMELMSAETMFRNIVFAVRSKGEESYNYREFARNFGRK